MAKHWKNFLKKEDTPKEEEELNFAESLLGATEKEAVAIDEIAGFNSTLKSLLDEQKQLEDKMAELTGKKTESSSDRKYDNEIKTIDQKKKEEKQAQERKQKPKKDFFAVDSISKSKEKKKIDPSFLVAKQVTNGVSNNKIVAKKITKTVPIISVSKKKVDNKIEKIKDNYFTEKEKTTEVWKEQKVKVGNTIKDKKNNLLAKAKKVDTTINLGKTLKKVDAVWKEKENIEKKLSDFENTFVSKTKLEKKQLPFKKEPVEEKNKLDSLIKTKEKIFKTVAIVQKSSSQVQEGMQKTKSVMNTVGIQNGNNDLTKAIQVVDTVNKNLDKVNKLFQTSNKVLDTTTTVVRSFEKRQNEADFIKAKDNDSKDIFDFAILQKKNETKEENKAFKVDASTIKSIKKGMDLIQNLKKSKDSFSF